MRILHCSDVHITADYRAIPFFQLGWRRWIALGELTFGGRARQYEHAGQTLSQIARQAEEEKVDHLILSGDLTAYALESEFRGAKEALSPFVHDKKRCTIIPGNHDVYTPEAVSTRRFHRYFGHLLESDFPEYQVEGAFPFVRVLDGLAVIGLSSAHIPLVPGLSYGRVGLSQLDALGKLVRDPRLEKHAVIVVVHHAPFRPNGQPDKWHHGLHDAQALLETLPGERFAVLHGHIHHRFHHPATSSRPHIFGAGSSTQLGREGFWLIDSEGGRIGRAEKRTVKRP